MVYQKKTISRVTKKTTPVCFVGRQATYEGDGWLPIIPASKVYKYLVGDEMQWKDYGCTWYRSLGGRVYHIVEFMNVSYATGEVDEDSKNAYAVFCSEIDLGMYGHSRGHVDKALQVAGMRRSDVKSDVDLVRAVYFAYGGAHEYRLVGNNAHKLLAEAKRGR